jgi:hypothetical protein
LHAFGWLLEILFRYNNLTRKAFRLSGLFDYMPNFFKKRIGYRNKKRLLLSYHYIGAAAIVVIRPKKAD